jgi:ubiquinone/menaquinone biosynthesis C-methylase UbiE
MSDSLHYDAAAAGGYNQSFGSVSSRLAPTLLRLAHVGRGQRILDVATGTGNIAEAAAEAVGLIGHVVAADISPPMLEEARKSLQNAPNISFGIEDGQALSASEGTFDAVLCSMALMLFSNPAKGLSEFYRVLRPGGHAAVSVNTTSERSYVTRIGTAIGRHVPSRAAVFAQYFSLGDPQRLHKMFETAGFREIVIETETYRFPFASFDTYFQPIERGMGSMAREYGLLPPEVRQKVREDVRREVEGSSVEGGPVVVEVEILFGDGHK